MRCPMTRIRVEGSAWLILGLYLLLLPFPWVIAMLLAAAVHELGHCIALFFLKEPVLGITIGPFGAGIETFSLDRKAEMISALAGPGLGLMLCFFWKWIPKAALFALIQSIFNLLPIWPMDGGRVLRILRKGRTG